MKIFCLQNKIFSATLVITLSTTAIQRYFMIFETIVYLIWSFYDMQSNQGHRKCQSFFDNPLWWSLLPEILGSSFPGTMDKPDRVTCFTHVFAFIFIFEKSHFSSGRQHVIQIVEFIFLRSLQRDFFSNGQNAFWNP